MSEPSIVRFYLEESLRESATAGRHNFIGKIETVLSDAGFDVEFRGNSLEERLLAPDRDGYAIFHMEEPTHARAFTFRRNYHYPFWHIEQTAKRWEWPVARAEFDPEDVPTDEATRFTKFWCRRLFGDWLSASSGRFVYMPLQGRLLERRSFQTMSPIRMIESVLEFDPERSIVAALHPKENYDAKELATLEKLEAKHARLTVTLGEMDRLLPACDYVATQNSGVALSGYFFGKPAVLFAKIDFHHIAAKVEELGAEEAIKTGPDLSPDYSAYLWWFFQDQSINAGRGDAETKIADALKSCGLPLT